jgi:hypothetical protein
VLVYGDPHILANILPGPLHQSEGSFKHDNGLFLTSNGSSVLVSASKPNMPPDHVETFAPGQAPATDPNNTDVWENQNGRVVDVGTMASLGMQAGTSPGQTVAAGQTANLGNGESVNFDGGQATIIDPGTYQPTNWNA